MCSLESCRFLSPRCFRALDKLKVKPRKGNCLYFLVYLLDPVRSKTRISDFDLVIEFWSGYQVIRINFFFKSKRHRFSKKKVNGLQPGFRPDLAGSHWVFSSLVFSSTRPGFSSGSAGSRVNPPGSKTMLLRQYFFNFKYLVSSLTWNYFLFSFLVFHFFSFCFQLKIEKNVHLLKIKMNFFTENDKNKKRITIATIFIKKWNL